MTLPLIEIRDLRKWYYLSSSRFEVLKKLNFKVEKGAFTVIMGKSGSGKTTLLNLMGLLDRFDEGNYIYNGVDVTRMNENQRSTFRNEHLGFIFQQFLLIDTLTVAQNIELPMLYYGKYSKAERMERVKKSLEAVDLLEKINSYPTQLSGGQQQRISIARALVNDPDIIMADEPTGALDSETGIEIIGLLQKLNAEGKTVIMVTHDGDFKKIASQFVYLKDGVFIEEVSQ